MNQEFLAVVEHFSRDRGIDKEILLTAVESSILSAAKKSLGPADNLKIVIDAKTGDIKVMTIKKVVSKPEHDAEEISLADARKIDKTAKKGGEVEIEVTPANFGRIAAQTAKQVIIHKVREAEKDIIYAEYKEKEGDILSGIVRKIERGNLVVDLGKTEAYLPLKEKCRDEDIKLGSRIRAYLVNVENTSRGPQINLSRAHTGFVKRLFELEVPEINEGIVQIRALARDPGFRTKLAVDSNDPKVDPIGACVGMKGSRVKNIVRELGGEKIDIIKWVDDLEHYAENIFSPLKIRSFNINEDTHTVAVVVDNDMLATALGRKGQNARLCSELLGWELEIKKMEDIIQHRKIVFEEEKEKEDRIEDKIREAQKALCENLSIDEGTAQTLVNCGFPSVEGILEAEIQDLIDCGIDEAAAQEIHTKAKAFKERS